MRSDPAALALARAWLRTPYVAGAAVRGVGCDCVGLVRGIWSELTGRPAPEVPGWRRDWAHDRGRPLMRAAGRYLEAVPIDQAGPGCVAIIRMGGREAHLGVLAEGDRLIHAVERVGVVEVPRGAFPIARAGILRRELEA